MRTIYIFLFVFCTSSLYGQTYQDIIDDLELFNSYYDIDEYNHTGFFPNAYQETVSNWNSVVASYQNNYVPVYGEDAIIEARIANVVSSFQNYQSFMTVVGNILPSINDEFEIVQYYVNLYENEQSKETPDPQVLQNCLDNASQSLDSIEDWLDSVGDAQNSAAQNLDNVVYQTGAVWEAIGGV